MEESVRSLIAWKQNKSCLIKYHLLASHNLTHRSVFSQHVLQTEAVDGWALIITNIQCLHVTTECSLWSDLLAAPSLRYFCNEEAVLFLTLTPAESDIWDIIYLLSCQITAETSLSRYLHYLISLFSDIRNDNAVVFLNDFLNETF